MTDKRLGRARALLERAGVAGGVSAAGSHQEILAVRAGPETRTTLARLAPEVRRLGFRYVALELAPEDASNPGTP